MLLNNSFHCLHHLPSLWHHQPKWSGLLRFDNLTLPLLYTIVVCTKVRVWLCLFWPTTFVTLDKNWESWTNREKKGHLCKFCDFKCWRFEWYMYNVEKFLYLSVFEQTTWNSKMRQVLLLKFQTRWNSSLMVCILE